VFFALLIVWLTVAGIEFWRLSTSDTVHPTLAFLLGAVWLVLADSQFPRLYMLEPGIGVLVLVSAGWQVFHRDRAPTAGWALELAGGLYLGVCGAYWVKLRALEPDGLWWVLTVLAAIMLADTGAYFVGRKWGHHALARTLSPGKTWEGYLGGIVCSVLSTALIGGLWHRAVGVVTVDALKGLIVGLVVSAMAPMGDLVVSMFKREAGVKDTGHIIPGHGGALDRVDSILWAGVIGYFLVLWLVTV